VTRWAPFAALAILILLVPLVAPPTVINTGIFVVLFAIASIGLSLLMGLAGQVSLGHAAFFAIGAYAQALLLTEFGAPPLVAGVGAVVLTVVIATLLGAILLRTRGHYLALTTLGFGIILSVVVAEFDITGGPSGIADVPKLVLLGHTFSDAAQYFWLVGAVLFIGIVLAVNIVRSRIGRALSAVGDSEVAAEVLGVDTFRLRLEIFVVAAIYASVAGILYAHWVSVVTPGTAGLGLSIEFLLICVIGGLGTVWGAVFGAVIIVALRELLQRFLPVLIPGAAGEIELVAFGALLIILVIWLPGGIYQAWRRLTASGFHDEPGSEGSADSTPDATRPVAVRQRDDSEPRLLLEVRNITKRFGGLVAVDGVSLEARAGEILALIGPNGAGKTTMFNLVTGVLTPTSGEVWLAGSRVDGHAPHVFALAGATRTFQNLQIFRSATAIGNVMVGRHLRSRAGIVASALSLPARHEEADIKATAGRILGRLGLLENADRPAADLPFGRQRVLELGRALALEPNLLLLDEPLAGLSGAERWELATTLRELRSEGMGIVIVEHDVDAVLALADRIAVLDNGRLIALGDPATVRNDPETITAYLGATDEDVRDESPATGPGQAQPTMGSSTKLAIRGLRAGYGRLEVLHGVDIEVNSGELVAVLGANGAGKTSLLRAISGLITTTGGAMTIGDKPLGRTPEAVAADGIAHVPENRLVFPTLSVRDNLLLGGWSRRAHGRSETDATVDRMLDLFPRLRDRLNQAAGTMSGGEQQMLAIARGLMARPSVILLDEPSLGLAPRIVSEIFRALARLRDEEHLAILLIEQNARAAFRVADRVYLMERGLVIAHGDADSLRDDEGIQRAYLGGGFGDTHDGPGSPASPQADHA